jgi:hypothetical protein
MEGGLPRPPEGKIGFCDSIAVSVKSEQDKRAGTKKGMFPFDV